MQPHPIVSIRDGQRADATSVAAILRDTGWFEQLNSEAVADTTACVTAALGLALANGQNALLVTEDATPALASLSAPVPSIRSNC